VRAINLLLAIVTLVTVTASAANAAPVKSKQAGTYTVQANSDTRWNQQDHKR
jgi:hypothetical protein